MTSFTKDPQAVLDFAFDWSAWLVGGETIASSTVTVPTGLLKDSEAHTTNKVIAWLSGGAIGQRYGVTCRITTNQGRTDERTIQITVRER